MQIEAARARGLEHGHGQDEAVGDDHGHVGAYISHGTLFARAGQEPVFAEVLDAFYDGQEDPATLQLLT